jgi:metal-responsive CopG/Arc/MetJ family transcriptional regulator
MRTVQLTLDEPLVRHVDALVAKLRMTRSAFARSALRAALAQHREAEMDRKHREGYRRKPPRKGEFDVWHAEQAWGEP